MTMYVAALITRATILAWWQRSALVLARSLRLRYVLRTGMTYDTHAATHPHATVRQADH